MFDNQAARHVNAGQPPISDAHQAISTCEVYWQECYLARLNLTERFESRGEEDLVAAGQVFVICL